MHSEEIHVKRRARIDHRTYTKATEHDTSARAHHFYFATSSTLQLLVLCNFYFNINFNSNIYFKTMAIPSTPVSASVIIVFVILMGVNNSLNATNKTF